MYLVRNCSRFAKMNKKVLVFPLQKKKNNKGYEEIRKRKNEK